MVLSISHQESAPGTIECEAGFPRGGVDCGEEENFCPRLKAKPDSPAAQPVSHSQYELGYFASKQSYGYLRSSLNGILIHLLLY